jgi:hypothetical protein
MTTIKTFEEFQRLNRVLFSFHPTLKDESLVVMGRRALTSTAPVSKAQKYKNISLVIYLSFSNSDKSPEWIEVLKQLQMEAARLLMDFGCPELAAANAKKVLEQEPDNIEANAIVAKAI